MMIELFMNGPAPAVLKVCQSFLDFLCASSLASPFPFSSPFHCLCQHHSSHTLLVQ